MKKKSKRKDSDSIGLNDSESFAQEQQRIYPRINSSVDDSNVNYDSQLGAQDMS